jgi:Fe-S-cluster-containing hydrogenase component 2
VSQLLRQQTRGGSARKLAQGWDPKELRYAPGQTTQIAFHNGKTAPATCIRCIDAPCAVLSDEETRPSNLPDFPADRNPSVCAAEAIEVPAAGGAPRVHSDRCVMCGVCASRCPVGAIRLVADTGAVVDDADSAAFVETSAVAKEQTELRSRFSKVPGHGTRIAETDRLVDTVFDRMARAGERVGDRYPNLITRSLLIGAGVGAALGRKGNNHMRMDLLLYPPGVERGVAAVEFGQEAVMEGPRDVLDSLAVLASRHKWDAKTTTAAVLSDSLPNRRSEYWHVVQDIAKTLSVKVQTITAFALMLANWNRIKLTPGVIASFYVDRDITSYRGEVLEKLIGRRLQLKTDPRSEIDLAK